jgi:hypothetical protein
METLTITIGVLILSLSVALSAVARYSIRSTSFEEALRSHNFRTQFDRVLATKAAGRKKKTTRRRFVRNRHPVDESAPTAADDGDNQLESGNETDNSGISGSVLPSASSQDEGEVSVVDEGRVQKDSRKSKKKSKPSGGKAMQRSVDQTGSALTPVVEDAATEKRVAVVEAKSIRGVSNETKRVSTRSAQPEAGWSPDENTVSVTEFDKTATFSDTTENRKSTVKVELVKSGSLQREAPINPDDVGECYNYRCDVN